MGRLKVYAEWVGVKAEELINEIGEWQEEHFDLAETRMTICKECERYNSKLKLCKECGCFMPAKTLWKETFCPLEKW